MDLAVIPTAAREMHLLIVDDEAAILQALRRVLRSSAWKVELANSSEEGLERFLALRPEVVISDFRMPGMNGVELLARIKELAPETQRIL
jgi:two-component system NtrC family sensor kinase